jgi:hypothetical protein
MPKQVRHDSPAAMKKRIGIKYCGGCNPGYERVEMIEKVQFRLGDQFLFHRYRDEDIEALILVSGCPRACAGQDLNQGKHVSYSITGEGDYETLIKWLTDFIEKGDSK